MRQTEEDEILLGFNNGKEQAYKAIFDLYYELLFRYAYSFIKNSQEAEDTVLISFNRLFSISEKRFTSISAIKNYIFRAVKFYSLNTIHKIRTRDGYYDDYKEQLIANGDDSFEIEVELFSIRSEVVRNLHAIIEEMPLQQRRIFKMIFFDEIEPEEVAKQLGITTQTVYAQKSRALSKIKKNINQNEHASNKNTNHSQRSAGDK